MEVDVLAGKFLLRPPPQLFRRRYNMIDPGNYVFEKGIKYSITIAMSKQHSKYSS
jgi:hypothetical protein